MRLRHTLLFATALASFVPASLLVQAQTPGDGDVQSFQKVEDRWSVAYAAKDQYAMELLLAPSFINISAGGSISTRNQTIAEMVSPTNGTLQSIEQKVVDARVIGDAAVVDGTYVYHYRQNSHNIDERGIFTHVYQRTRGNAWTCVNAQRTIVVDQSDEKTPGAKSLKKSNAEAPFHIPLLYKGADKAAQPDSSQAPSQGQTQQPSSPAPSSQPQP